MNKRLLLKKIVAQLTDELGLFYKAAKASHAEATHENNKAENKYDTRALEASYLAGGQARKVAELEETIAIFETLAPRDFKRDEPIDVTALVTLEMRGESTLFFVAPRSGGLEIMQGKEEITVITLQSPLGAQLAGKKAGDKFKFGLGSGSTEYKIISVI